MYPASFEYHRPQTLAEAQQLLATTKDAKLLAGGHSLLPAMKMRVAGAATLLDIGRLAELRGIRRGEQGLVIGATTTHAEVAASEDVQQACPILAEAAAQIGDLQVRNRGTLGGSLAHADPAADLPAVMLLLGARMSVAGAHGTRDVAAAEFFVDLFTTALGPDEILTAVTVPGYKKGTGAAYLKHRHPASSYAVVGVAALVELRDGRCARAGLVIGGATPVPVRATAAEQALAGQAPGAAAFAGAADKVQQALVDPLSDPYASAEFRAHLATVLARRALVAAAQRAQG